MSALYPSSPQITLLVKIPLESRTSLRKLFLTLLFQAKVYFCWNIYIYIYVLDGIEGGVNNAREIKLNKVGVNGQWS